MKEEIIKKIILYIILILVLSCQKSKIEVQNLELKEGLLYSKNYPYTGICLNMFGNSISNVVEGELNGETIIYYKNGTILMRGQFNSNLQHGTWKEYSENERIISEKDYILGNLDGIFKIFYENGILKTKREFKNNNPNGKTEYYFENGVIQSVAYYKNGYREGKEIIYYKNGNILSESYFSGGRLTGTDTTYYENGLKNIEKIYQTEADSIKREWYENGNLKSYTKFENYIKVVYEYYDKTGNLKWKFKTEQDKIIEEHFRNNGKIKYIFIVGESLGIKYIYNENNFLLSCEKIGNVYTNRFD